MNKVKIALHAFTITILTPSLLQAAAFNQDGTQIVSASDSGHSVHIWGIDEWMLFHLALMGEWDQVYKLLDNKGTDINAKNPKSEGGWADGTFQASLLTEAIDLNHLDAVKELLNRGINVYAVDSKGDNALMHALQNYKQSLDRYQKDPDAPWSVKRVNEGVDIIKQLLLKGGLKLAEQKNYSGQSPLDYAHASKIALFQIEPKVLVPQEEPYVLRKALADAKQGLWGYSILAIEENRISVNDKDKTGTTLLNIALSQADIHIIRDLLERGANLQDALGQMGKTTEEYLASLAPAKRGPISRIIMNRPFKQNIEIHIPVTADNIISVPFDINDEDAAFTLETFKDLIGNGSRNFIVAFTQVDGKWFSRIFDGPSFNTYSATQGDQILDPMSREVIQYTVPIEVAKVRGQYRIRILQ